MAQPRLDAVQARSIQVIGAVLNRARLPAPLREVRAALRLALIINAYAESDLRPTAMNVVGSDDSHGLFQTNRKGGVGAGWTVKQLQNPAFNVALILGELVRQDRATGVFSALILGRGDVGELTATFTVHVEQPADAQFEGVRRSLLVGEWWGSPVMTAHILGYPGSLRR